MKIIILSCFLFYYSTICVAQQKVWEASRDYIIQEIVTVNNKIFYPLNLIDFTSKHDIAVTAEHENNALIVTSEYNFDEVKELTVLGSNVFFSGKLTNQPAGLWITDGTVAGTKELFRQNAHVKYLTVFNNKIYFSYGDQIWCSDGTASGTKKILDINNDDLIENYPYVWLKAVNNKLVYYYWGKLGVTDGSSSDVTFLSDNTGNPITNSYLNVNVCNDKLYFVNHTESSGYELWSTDGTSENTGLLKEINPGASDGFERVNHELYINFTSSDNKVYFTADKGTGSKVWVTDGTTDGTIELSGNWVSGLPELLTSIDGNLYFRYASYTISGTGVMFADGSDNTIRLLKGEGTSVTEILTYPYSYIKYDGMVYFVATDPDHGYELWKTDNTTSGTVRITDICKGSCFSFNSSTALIGCGNTLFFSASDQPLSTSNYQLWKLSLPAEDPTSTQSIKEFATKPYPNPCQNYTLVEMPSVPTSVKIITVLGEVCIPSYTWEDKLVRINTSQLTSGVYQLVIDDYKAVSIMK